MQEGLSLAPRNLSRKLLALFFLMFVLPFLYMLFVVWQLAQHADLSDASMALLSLRIGIPAAVVMALSGMLLMLWALRPIQAITRNAYTFYKELHGDKADTVLANTDEAQRIALYVTDMITELRHKLSDVDRYAGQLDSANRKLMELAVNDGLTDLYNHKHVRHLLLSELGRAQRFKHSLGIIMLDIDNFKMFNDTYGHLVGDKALRTIGDIIRRSVRSVDTPARYGGEEFLVILPEADAAAATQVAERVREAIAAHVFETGQGEQTTRLTASIGVSAYTGQEIDDKGLIARADECLYKAKRSGKNKVSS